MKPNEDFEAPEELIIEEPLTKTAQIDLTEILQTMLLKTYERRLKKGVLSDTGLASLQRLLQSNGWTLDPSQLPQGLQSLLTSKVDPSALDEEGVFPINRKQA